MRKALILLLILAASCNKKSSDPKRCWVCTKVLTSSTVTGGNTQTTTIDSVCDRTAAEIKGYKDTLAAEYSKFGNVTFQMSCY